jgi:hypothetical protein
VVNIALVAAEKFPEQIRVATVGDVMVILCFMPKVLKAHLTESGPI